MVEILSLNLKNYILFFRRPLKLSHISVDYTVLKNLSAILKGIVYG